MGREPLRLSLRRPLARVLAAGHPWVYREALAGSPAVEPGAEVRVVDERGRIVARGLAEAGPIAVRVFSTRDEPFSAQLIEARVRDASTLRLRGLPPDTDAYRVLHGEGDRLPGVVCDRYGPWAVLKLDGQAALAHTELFVDVIARVLFEQGVRGLVLRQTGRHAPPTRAAAGERPDEEVEVRERGMRLLANLWRGQKTGLFLDHRESRFRVRGLAEQARVLNLYGYTGGFSVAAGLGGARELVTVDVAEAALDLATRTVALNAIDAPHEVVVSDVPEFLKRAKEEGRRFDLIVADPPNFAPNEASLKAALKSYRALHRAALALLEPGGLYLAASCSSHVRSMEFEGTLREGAANVPLQVLERHGAPLDHPRLLAFPEGDYLKVVLARRI